MNPLLIGTLALHILCLVLLLKKTVPAGTSDSDAQLLLVQHQIRELQQKIDALTLTAQTLPERAPVASDNLHTKQQNPSQMAKKSGRSLGEMELLLRMKGNKPRE